MKKNRLLYLDLLKIGACVLVIVNHAGISLINYGQGQTWTVFVYVLSFSVSKIAVPIFIMVSGSLLLNKDRTLRQMLTKIIRIWIPLILISLWVSLPKTGLSLSILMKTLTQLISKPAITPFWYLYMLSGLYLATPFIRKMISNFKAQDFRNFIILFLILPGFAPLLQKAFGLSLSAYATLAIFPAYIAYFVAGHYLSTLEKDKKLQMLAVISFTLAIGVMVNYMMQSFLIENKISYFLDNVTYITTAVPAIAVFYGIKSIYADHQWTHLGTKVITMISELTFGIYLIHYFLIYRITNLKPIQNLLVINPTLGTLSVISLVFIGSGLIIYVLKKIPLIKDIL